MSNMTPNDVSDQTITRRSGNYPPPVWDDDFIQSLKSEYVWEKYVAKIEDLKRGVSDMLKNIREALHLLEMIDVLQHLGIDYHFVTEIKRPLNNIYNDINENKLEENQDLCTTALKFRILRQNGYNVIPEIFKSFKEEQGKFKPCISNDVKGMLYLYEASFLLIEGETILEEARDFTAKELQHYLRQGNGDYLSLLVGHALEFPTHWRMPRLEARWFIDAYETNPDKNPLLLEFAKLDFNLVQTVHQDDLKQLSMWWKKGHLGVKLPFARDRLVENFLWAVGVKFEPQFGSYRRMLTKLGVLVTILDDAYDVYGTKDELELLTSAIVRWDVNVTDELPNYLKILFLAIYNVVNQMAFDILQDRDSHILPYLKKAWADITISYSLEFNWYHTGYTPTLREYLDNGWITITVPLLLVHSYIFVTHPIITEKAELAVNYPSVIQLSSMLVRLVNDLGTSSFEVQRGDNPKSIQCYIHETGASEENAQEHINYLIQETWKKLNKDCVVDAYFSKTFMEMAMNIGRMAQCMYQNGDGHGVQAGFDTKSHIISLLIKPIPLNKN